MSRGSQPVRSNPFATRFVQPGQLPWISATAALSLPHLATRFAQLNCRAAIVGPHGSGKSTLLAHLVPCLGEVRFRSAAYEVADNSQRLDQLKQIQAQPDTPQSQRRNIVWLALRGHHASRILVRQTRNLWTQPNSLLVIDGYEQLRWWLRAWLLWTSRQSGTGILITTHRPTALPTLVETYIDPEVARQLIERLLPAELAHREQYLDRTQIEMLLAKHQGNLRETFMELYDRFRD